jgi:sarcosine oxidase subunit beta
MRLLEGYLAAAQRLGARVEWGTEVTGFERGGSGKLSRVLTTRGAIGTGAVINAAGPWAGSIAQLAGAELPVIPLRRQVAATTPNDLLPADMPMTIFAGDGFHFRVRDRRVLLLLATPGVATRPFDASVDPKWVTRVAGIARERIPVFERAEIDHEACHAGLYEMSPDRHAILGAAPECENLYFINGSSGHGIMHSPALGQLLAELIVDGKTSIDTSALSPSRFEEEKLNTSSELL